jgi:hypothetical protein
MKIWDDVSKWLKLQKEGFLVGAGIGAIIYFFKINLSFLELEQTGLAKLAVLIFIFSSVGALIDSVWRPKK